MKSLWISPALVVASAALAAGVGGACTTSEVGSPPPPVLPPAGSVTMDWTIDGTKDSGLCTQSSAATFNVILVDSTGAAAGQWVQSCAAFATTIEGLSPGTYSGSANLIGANGARITTAVQIPAFYVLSGGGSTVAVEFPRSSFFQNTSF